MNGLHTIPIALNTRSEGGAEWIQLTPPAGTFQGRDGRAFRLRDATAVIEASQQHAGRRLIPVDYDHQIDLAPKRGGTAPAAGWIDALQARNDGIWGRVQWTERAAAHIARKEYRYVSPVFAVDHDGDVRALLRAALVNNPNLDQLKALCRMESRPMDDLAELRELLELPADADTAAIVKKVRELLATKEVTNTPDPSRFVPIGQFERAVAEVNRLNQGISLQAAQDHVAEVIARGSLVPWLHDWGVQLCSVNKPAFDDFVKRTGRFLHALTGSRLPMNYSEDAAGSGGLSEAEIAIASNLGVSQDAFRKTRTARNAQER